MMMDVDALPGSEHLVHQLVESERTPLRNELERATRHPVDSHADRLGQRRLLAKAHQPLGFDAEHAEIEHLVAAGRRNGERRPGRGVAIEEGAQVEIGQHVGVHDQEMVRKIVQQPQRPERAQRLRLERVAQRHAELFAVAEIGSDQIPHVIDGQSGDVEPRLRQPANGNLDDRRVADRHQGLGQDHGEGPQPRSLAARENDRVSHSSPLRRRPPRIARWCRAR